MSLISKRKPKLTSSKFPEHKFRQNTPLPIKKNQKKKKLRKLPKFSVGKPALKKRDENSHFHCWEKLQNSPLSHGTFLHIFRYTFRTYHVFTEKTVRNSKNRDVNPLSPTIRFWPPPKDRCISVRAHWFQTCAVQPFARNKTRTSRWKKNCDKRS